MTKALFTLALTVLIPWVSEAKAPTVRMTIVGATLPHTIEINDPKILELSHAWGASFIDQARPPETHAPREGPVYEVSLYSEIDKNDIRKTCVFFYYPSLAAEQGSIYLPGKDKRALWALNVGTIMRGEMDGKWNYANRDWEALIKAILTRAPVAEFKRSASEITVNSWTQPKPGWLYVLDPRSEADRPASRVWLVDPESGRVMGSINAGYNPDFSLSPDGKQLIIESGERESGERSIVDTPSGKIHHNPLPDRVLYRPWYAGLPPYKGAWPPLCRIADDAAIYAGFGDMAADGTSVASGIQVLDPFTLQVRGTIMPSAPFWSIAAGKNGIVYAAIPTQGRVLAIDSVSGKELRAILVGKTPALVLVAP